MLARPVGQLRSELPACALGRALDGRIRGARAPYSWRSDVVFVGADEALAVFGIEDPARLRALFPEPEHLIVSE
jgi:hypothetical protein